MGKDEKTEMRGQGQTLSVGKPCRIAAAMLLMALGCRAILAAEVVLSSGEPDPTCGDLRLWLRADAGVRDAAGHSPADPDFSGSVAIWSDQSPRHYDLAALPEHAPSYVVSQPGAGGRPTLAFGGGRLLARPNDALHDHVNATMLLVLQLVRSRELGNIVYTVGEIGGRPMGDFGGRSMGEFGGRWEALSFDHVGESETGQGFVRWLVPTLNRQFQLREPLQITADGRFVIMLLRSAGDGSSLEIQDGLGDSLGANREMVPLGVTAVSNRCGNGFWLGGQRIAQSQTGYDGQIAEVMVYDRNLSSAERRKLIAYLRGKYGLDVLDAMFPAGTALMQAEDFDGPWQINARWDSQATMCLGNRHVTSRDQAGGEGMRRTVLIPRPGNYSVWVRAINQGNEGGLRTLVGDKRLGVTHADRASGVTWQLAGKVDMPAGETEIVVRGEGPGRKECDAVVLSPTASTLAGVEEICALARRLRQAPGACQLAAVFEDGRRIEGNLVSGFKGSGARMTRDPAARPGVRLLLLDGAAADAAPSSDALLEFHNGDRIRGSIHGYAAATTLAGESIGAQLLVEPSADFGKAEEKPISVEIDWLRRLVFDPTGPPRRCPPRSVVCRDGEVIAFRAVRFSGDGVSLLTASGLKRLAYRELVEIVLPPVDAWEAYHRQLAIIDPQCEVGVVRLEAQHGMVLTAGGTRCTSFRADNEPAASTCLIQPAWSRTAIPLAWSAVRSEWRAPACVVPLSQFAPQQAAQGGDLGISWKWQADHNVAGGELRSGGAGYLWGFGVHARNELVFPLPPSALAFRSGLGIDAAVGDFGCVVGKVYVNGTAGTPAFQSKPLIGSQTAISTGNIALNGGNSPVHDLTLIVEGGGTARGSNAAPLDIGDHADWLEPTLLLDPVKLRAAVQKFRSGK
jgi:hypothetical protein